MWCSARSCMTVKWLLEPLMSLGPCQSVFKLATMAVTSAGLTPWTTWNVVGARTENNLECYAFKMFSEISKKEYVGDHGLMLQLSQCIRWESDWQSKTSSRQDKPNALGHWLCKEWSLKEWSCTLAICMMQDFWPYLYSRKWDAVDVGSATH